MTIRGFISIVAVAALVFATSLQDLRAAGPAVNEKPDLAGVAAFRSTTSVELHQVVQESHRRGLEARRSVEGFLARPEVRNQIRNLGISSETLAARVALLSEADVLRLNDRIMASDLQNAPAGLSSGAIVAIVLIAVAGGILLLWLLIEEADEDWNY